MDTIQATLGLSLIKYLKNSVKKKVAARTATRMGITWKTVTWDTFREARKITGNAARMRG